jgi:hypothetical protein
MSLYFSMAVWASLALCVGYALEDHLPRYRVEAAASAAPTAAAEHGGRFGFSIPGWTRPAYGGEAGGTR